MRKFFSAVWTISIGITIGSAGLWVGSVTAVAAKYYAITFIVSVIVLITGLVIIAIETNAYSRGYETADSIRVKEMEERDG